MTDSSIRYFQDYDVGIDQVFKNQPNALLTEVWLFAPSGVTIKTLGIKSMHLSRFGLQNKIIIIIAIAVISVVGVSTYIAMLLTRLPVEEEIYRKNLSQAKLIAQQLVQDKLLQDQKSLLQTLQQIQTYFPGVQQSDVYLHVPTHHLISTTASENEHLELDNIPGIERYNEYERPADDQITIETPDGKFWIIGTNLRDGNLPIGCLNLKISKARSNLITLDLVKRNLLLMLASLTVLILVVHVFFLRSVRAPMREMVRVMEGAEGGQLNIRAHVSNLDETGQLAEHLNRMLGRIENFNTELARKVEEATSELAQRNEELKRINEELFETQKNLARSERLAVAGQLAASLAHEIGTPLNSISGHVQLLARKKTGDSVSDRRLQIIENQIEIIVRTVKQLLSWTHKFDLHIQPLDLRHVLEESLLLSSLALQHRKIRVQTECAPDFPRIYGDAGYLQQVFLNLINNSMDAMPHGGDLRLRLRYPADGDPRGVAVELADTGDGIAPETLAHIFEPMFTTKRMGTGAGLGLAICDQIVRQHGGTILAESELKRGTRFTILLPVDCREKIEGLSGTPAMPMANVS
jgi:signal transduction histidine kinase